MLQKSCSIVVIFLFVLSFIVLKPQPALADLTNAEKTGIVVTATVLIGWLLSDSDKKAPEDIIRSELDQKFRNAYYATNPNNIHNLLTDSEVKDMRSLNEDVDNILKSFKKSNGEQKAMRNAWKKLNGVEKDLIKVLRNVDRK